MLIMATLATHIRTITFFKNKKNHYPWANGSEFDARLRLAEPYRGICNDLLFYTTVCIM